MEGAKALLVRSTGLRRLITGEPDDPILSVAPDRVPVTVTPLTDREHLAQTISKYDLLAVPVVDNGKILGIVTNSLTPGEPKNPNDSNIFAIYQAFASTDETAAMRRAYAEGIGWGEAKQKLFERINAELAPMRERYDALIANPAQIEQQLPQIAPGQRIDAGGGLVKEQNFRCMDQRARQGELLALSPVVNQSPGQGEGGDASKGGRGAAV